MVVTAGQGLVLCRSRLPAFRNNPACTITGEQEGRENGAG